MEQTSSEARLTYTRGQSGFRVNIFEARHTD